MRWLLTLACVLAPAIISAQPVGPDAALRDGLAWKPEHQAIADKLSTGLVVGALVGPCLFDRSWRCVVHEGVRVGLAVGVAELAKHAITRERPNGRDRKSFFSEHTAVACAAVATSRLWAICPSVAYLRVAADWHWSTDVLVGSVFVAVQW